MSPEITPESLYPDVPRRKESFLQARDDVSAKVRLLSEQAMELEALAAELRQEVKRLRAEAAPARKARKPKDSR